MQRFAIAGAQDRLANRQLCCRQPILPGGACQSAWHRPVSRQPDCDGNEAVRGIAFRNMPDAVGRVGQAMQENRRPDGIASRREDKRAVPVVREVGRIKGAPVKIAIGCGPVLWLKPGNYFLLD